MANIFDMIRKILVDELGVDEKAVEPSASFIDDLNMDADDIAEFLTTIEDVFTRPGTRVEIPGNEADNLVTIQNLVDYLQDMGIDN